MKRPAFVFCLLAALVLPALIFILWPAAKTPLVTAAPGAPGTTLLPKSSDAAPLAKSPGATVALTKEEAVQRFVETIGVWEAASGPEGDRIEEQLRNLMTDENAEAILRALPPRFHGTYVGNLLLGRWAARDRTSVIQWLAGQNNPTLFEVNAVTKDWVVQDSEGLQRYLDTLPASAWKSLVLESAARDALTYEAPELAFSLLEGVNENPAKVPLLARAAQQWAQWDPRAAVEAINKLPDSVGRERLILAVASGYALTNPDAAADWVRQSFAGGPTLDSALAGVMQAWVSTGDPARAVQWITRQPTGSTRDHVFKELIAAWKEANPDTLEYWMSTLPEGPIRAQAAAAISSLASLP
jgi:hypothetical protein